MAAALFSALRGHKNCQGDGTWWTSSKVQSCSSATLVHGYAGRTVGEMAVSQSPEPRIYDIKVDVKLPLPLVPERETSSKPCESVL